MTSRRRGWPPLACALVSAAASCLQLAMGLRLAAAREAGAIAGDAEIPSPSETPRGAAEMPAAPASPPSADAAQGFDPDPATTAEPVEPDDSPAPGVDAIPPPRATGAKPAPVLPRRVSRPPPAVAHAANEVAIRLMVEPPVATHVFWGVKDLGATPLEIIRPRGSGPLDLILRAPGYLTFHTRAHTDRDDRIAIRMVPVAQAAGVFGYRRGGNLEGIFGKSADSVSGSRRGNPADRATKR